jgi:hypothetical protein
MAPAARTSRYQPERADWNQRVVAEFRANEGRVGGSFEGAPMILVHHVGR